MGELQERNHYCVASPWIKYTVSDITKFVLSATQQFIHLVKLDNEQYVTCPLANGEFIFEYHHNGYLLYIIPGMRVFRFLTDFRCVFFFCFFFFGLLRPFFIIEQNAPKCSKWVYLFHNIPGGTPLQDIFRGFFIATHSHACCTEALQLQFGWVFIASTTCVHNSNHNFNPTYRIRCTRKKIRMEKCFLTITFQLYTYDLYQRRNIDRTSDELLPMCCVARVNLKTIRKACIIYQSEIDI